MSTQPAHHHNHTTRGIQPAGDCPACDALHEAQALQDLIPAGGVNVTRAEDELARGVAMLTLRTLGYTEKQAAKMWEDDIEGRDVFRRFAKEHATRIRAEAKIARKARRA